MVAFIIDAVLTLLKARIWLVTVEFVLFMLLEDTPPSRMTRIISSLSKDVPPYIFSCALKAVYVDPDNDDDVDLDAECGSTKS